MAFVHPSRMALVPKDSGFGRPSGSRLPSPPVSPSHPRPSSASRERDRSDNNYHHRRNRDEDERRRDRGRSSDRDVHRDRGRRESPYHSNGDRSSARSPPRSSRSPRGRASPKYDDYSRRDSAPPPPPSNDDSPRRSDMPSENGHPWRQQENMYRRDGRFDGGGDYFERRRQQRVNNTLSIWPPSPRAPTRDLSPERHQESRRKHKRERSTSVSSSSTDEEDRRHRERKERKRARKEKGRRGRRHRTYSDDEAHERHRDSRRKRSRSTSREPRKTPSRSQSPRREPSIDEDEWVEKPAPSGSFVPSVPTTRPTPIIQPPSAIQKKAFDGDVSDEEVGPQPASAPSVTKKLDERAYGGALLRGEGSAMAAFLQDGTDVRIPRRGEIGLTSDEIGDFESVGYVMSGSRHRRMNAVRMRKENQVISAEEKRGILKLQQEEKQRREAILREEFQELLADRLKGTEGTKTSS